MSDNGVPGDEQTIDWDNLLNNLPDDLNFDFLNDPSNDATAAANGFSTSPDSGISLSIDDIEQYLLNEEDSNHQQISVDEFFADVLLDSPHASESERAKDSSSSPETVEESEKDEDKPEENGAVMQTNENGDVVVDVGDDDNDDDPAAKKRKRKMRNRDAAVRSRERKKSYVKDLEIKNRYFEAECKRLGIVLQCCLAENQALRLSLHNSKAFDASMTKQESAVLLLESLLLGSLLWFLGIMCLLILPTPLLSTLENVDREEWERVAQRKTGNDVFRVSVLGSSLMGKRCKASRSRMKPSLLLDMLGSVTLSMSSH